jgi:hypothetical protein
MLNSWSSNKSCVVIATFPRNETILAYVWHLSVVKFAL